MIYFWYDIMLEYDNKIIKYFVDGGINWEIIIFVNGMYLYIDLEYYIYKWMRK